MMAHERPEALYHVAAIQLERIRYVVVAQTEEKLDEEIEDAIEDHLEHRIIDHSSALGPTSTKNAIHSIPFHCSPEANQIGGTIGSIRHENRYRVSNKT